MVISNFHYVVSYICSYLISTDIDGVNDFTNFNTKEGIMENNNNFRLMLSCYFVEYVANLFKSIILFTYIIT